MIKPQHGAQPERLAVSVAAVVFDLGGVLTTGLFEALLHMVETHHVHAAPSRARLLSLWGPLYLQASLGQLQPDDLWRQFRRHVDLGSLPVGREDQEFLSAIRLREADISHTLAELKQRYLVGLLSNHVGRWARALSARFALLPLLDAVVISSEIGARKPAPVTYERICQLLGVAPEQAVYIADEEEDLIGCHAVGMFPIFIAGEDTSSSIGLQIESLSGLLRLL